MNTECPYRTASPKLAKQYRIVSAIPLPKAWKTPLRTWIARRIRAERRWDRAFLWCFFPDGTQGSMDASMITAGKVLDDSITSELRT